MRAVHASLSDLTRAGPPFLLVVGEGDIEGLTQAAQDLAGDVLWRRMDARSARDVASLCLEIARSIESSFGTNLDALYDVMCDPDWVSLPHEAGSTAFVIEHSSSLLADRKDGFAEWGTMADSWARSWATPDGLIPKEKAIPLHFIHVGDRFPRNGPLLTPLDLEAR